MTRGAIGRMDTEATENPVAQESVAIKAASFEDVEHALTRLKDGSITEAEVVQTMEAAVESKVAALLETKVQTGMLSPMVKAITAKFTESPTNWHQAVTFFLLTTAPEDTEVKKWVVFLFSISVLIVTMQVFVAAGLMRGTFAKACETSDQCDFGRFCHIGGKGRCLYCGESAPFGDDMSIENHLLENPEILEVQSTSDTRGFVYNKTSVRALCEAPIASKGISGAGVSGYQYYEYPEAAVVEWCDRCVHPVTLSVDLLSNANVALSNLNSMSTFDWMALYLCALIAALTFVAEIKDVMLCNIAINRANKKDLDVISRVCFNGLLVINGVRRWTFLPLLTGAIMVLVVIGTDALSVCFNTIACLFLCEVDNICYAIGLGERLRARVEAAGRVELNQEERADIVRMKGVFTLALFLVPVLYLAATPVTGLLFLHFSNIFFLAAAIVEALMKGGSPIELAVRTGKRLATWFLGFVLVFFVVNLVVGIGRAWLVIFYMAIVTIVWFTCVGTLRID